MDTIRPRSVRELEGDKSVLDLAIAEREAARIEVEACRAAGHFSRNSGWVCLGLIDEDLRRLRGRLATVQRELSGRR